MTRTFVILAILGATATASAAIELHQITGLWKFPDKAVWIQINADGSTFQCRIPKEGAVITSFGRFTPPDSISWKQNWGVEKIEHRPGELKIHANVVNKTFTYVPAKGPMASSCKVAHDA